MRLGETRTRDNVTGIHGILVFDEAKAVHQFDLGNLAGAMGSEVRGNIGLGDFGRGGKSVWYVEAKPGGKRRETAGKAFQRGRPCRNPSIGGSKRISGRSRRLTVPGQVAQVQAGGGNLSHGCSWGGRANLEGSRESQF